MMKKNPIEAKKSYLVILKSFTVFGVIFLIFGFLLGVSLGVNNYSGLEFDNIAQFIWYIIYFYLSYLLGFFIFKQVYIRNKGDFYFNEIKFLAYFLLFFYYFAVLFRTDFLNTNNIFYGFRFMLGFICPFWILMPLFLTNVKSKIDVYFCVLICVAEIIFWVVYFKIDGSDFYKSPNFVIVLMSSLIFTLTFPWYLSWLQKIDVNKWMAPLFFKKERFISKVISWIAIVLGGLFIFLFYLCI